MKTEFAVSLIPFMLFVLIFLLVQPMVSEAATLECAYNAEKARYEWGGHGVVMGILFCLILWGGTVSGLFHWHDQQGRFTSAVIWAAILLILFSPYVVFESGPCCTEGVYCSPIGYPLKPS
jgi:hypothetical protein